MAEEGLFSELSKGGLGSENSDEDVFTLDIDNVEASNIGESVSILGLFRGFS